jgi:hypothetical protein
MLLSEQPKLTFFIPHPITVYNNKNNNRIEQRVENKFITLYLLFFLKERERIKKYVIMFQSLNVEKM